jgi:hypothetical protein
MSCVNYVEDDLLYRLMVLSNAASATDQERKERLVAREIAKRTTKN